MAISNITTQFKCPCCHSNSTNMFREETIFTLVPATMTDHDPKKAYAQNKKKVSACRSCGYIVELSESDPANLLAKTNYANKNQYMKIVAQALRKTPTDTHIQNDQPTATAADTTTDNSVEFVLTEDEDEDIIANTTHRVGRPKAQK